jgi:hypothetical protein
MNISCFKKTFLALALAGFAVTSHASLSITATNTIDSFDAESGQSIPTGVKGWVDGTVSTTGGLLTFTYGRDLGLVAGATGFGNASFVNEFSLGGSTTNCFANHAGSTCTNTGNNPFTVNVAAGTISFAFLYNLPGTSDLGNGGSPNVGTGAYLAAGNLSTTTPFGGPTNVVYLGLSDGAYLTGGDHDFQDIALSITAVPEPESYAMMLAGLGLMGFVMRRRNQKVA